MKLPVTVTRVLYPPSTQEATWFVLLTEHGKACGSMLWRPEPGERLILVGEWDAYRGERNYKFKEAYQNVPISPRDQLVYVCERATGIGPAMMEAIWTARGNDWLSIEPGEVPRLTGTRYDSFREAVALLETEAEKSEAIAWLMSHGATVGFAQAAWEQFGKETMGVISANCYRLTELPHHGFTDVDGQIRESFGIGNADSRRIRAAILYSLSRLTSYGDTVIDWASLKMDVCKLIGAEHEQLVSDCVSEMFQDGGLHGFPGTQSIALGSDYRDEAAIWDWVQKEVTV